MPEQSEPGEAVEVTLDLSSVSLPSNALLVVGDYAGNTYAARALRGIATPHTAQLRCLYGVTKMVSLRDTFQSMVIVSMPTSERSHSINPR